MTETSLRVRPRSLPVIGEYLQDQSDLSAVERFAQRHSELGSQALKYRDLIPLSKLATGFQYAFEVDLDKCSGCKACVTACHNLNGLDRQETWRSVGLLLGGDERGAFRQTVTTACHHCLEPACLKGCPVDAYVKDEQTGIVRHLDDQCIGCQYCTLTCPYEVPQFNAARGVVRKCDMCSDRLQDGEAPACVQACPTEAIAIRAVDLNEVREAAHAHHFLPGAPSPELTLPSTRYKTSRPFPRNTLPANYYRASPSKAHTPLVFMLVLTQVATGLFWMSWLFMARPELALARYLALAGWALGGLGLVVSMLHLGRPLYAFRALVGLRHSWLSREAAGFGLFMLLASLSTALLHRDLLPPLLAERVMALSWSQLRVACGAAALSGTLGIVASAFVYAVTGRAFWRLGSTLFRFGATALSSSVAATLALLSVLPAAMQAELGSLTTPLGWALMLTTSIKLALELGFRRHLRAGGSELRRSALLYAGELRGLLRPRIAFGALGGIVVPGWLLAEPQSAALLAVPGCALLLAGELLERSLFFLAVQPPRMPSHG